MQGMLSAGIELNAGEERCGVADVMHRQNLGRIEKAAAAFRVRQEKVAPAGAAQAEGGFLACGAEGTIACDEAPRGPLAESGASSCVDHETGLVSILGEGGARDDLHRLNGVGGNRCRKNLVALILY